MLVSVIQSDLLIWTQIWDGLNPYRPHSRGPYKEEILPGKKCDFYQDPVSLSLLVTCAVTGEL